MAVKLDAETLSEEIAALKKEVATLTESLKNGDLRGKLDSAVKTLSDDASRLYSNVSDRGKQSVETLSHSIEDKPLHWVLGAFAVGFVASLLVGGRR